MSKSQSTSTYSRLRGVDLVPPAESTIPANWSLTRYDDDVLDFGFWSAAGRVPPRPRRPSRPPAAAAPGDAQPGGARPSRSPELFGAHGLAPLSAPRSRSRSPILLHHPAQPSSVRVRRRGRPTYSACSYLADIQYIDGVRISSLGDLLRRTGGAKACLEPRLGGLVQRVSTSRDLDSPLAGAHAYAGAVASASTWRPSACSTYSARPRTQPAAGRYAVGRWSSDVLKDLFTEQAGDRRARGSRLGQASVPTEDPAYTPRSLTHSSIWQQVHSPSDRQGQASVRNSQLHLTQMPPHHPSLQPSKIAPSRRPEVHMTARRPRGIDKVQLLIPPTTDEALMTLIKPVRQKAASSTTPQTSRSGRAPDSLQVSS